MTPDWLQFLIGVFGRSLLLAGAGVLACFAVRHGSNALRHWAVVFSLGSLVLLPVFFWPLPRIRWAVLPASTEPIAPTPPVAEANYLWWLAGLWGAGVAWRLFRLAGAARGVGRLVAGMEIRPLESGADEIDALKAKVGIRRSVRIGYSKSISRPIVCGLWKPCVLLPTAAVDWHATRIRRVLAHEFAHVVRGDLCLQWLSQIVRAIYWFNPLVPLLAGWLVREREIAADELALAATGDDRRGYARELLALVDACQSRAAATDGSSPGMSRAAAAGMVGATSKLEERITRLLGDRPDRKASRRTVVTLLSAALPILAACCTLDPVAPGPPPSPWTDKEVQLRLSADPFPAD